MRYPRNHERLQTLLRLIPPTEPRLTRFNALLNFLLEHTDFSTAPASTHYHNSHEGGLAEHSVEVAWLAYRLGQMLEPRIDVFSLIMCGLFHDLGKIGAITTNKFGQPVQTPRYVLERETPEKRLKYNYNPKLMKMDIGTCTLRLVEKFIDLYEDEAQCLRYSDGLYVPENQPVWANHEYTPLTWIVSAADNWQGIVVECPEKYHPLMHHTDTFRGFNS